MVLAHPFEQLHTGGTRHFLIAEDNVDRLTIKQLFSSFGGIGGEYAEVGAEQMSQRRQDVMLVIDNKERASGYAQDRPPCVRPTRVVGAKSLAAYR